MLTKTLIRGLTKSLLVHSTLKLTYFSDEPVGFRGSHLCWFSETGLAVMWSTPPGTAWEIGAKDCTGRMGRGTTESTEIGDDFNLGGGALTGLNAGDWGPLAKNKKGSLTRIVYFIIQNIT